MSAGVTHFPQNFDEFASSRPIVERTLLCCLIYFANRRANRMKVLVHDGTGIWLAARWMNQGQFVWPQPGTDTRRAITQEQLAGLVLGFPWQRIGQDGVIRVANRARVNRCG